MNITKIELMNFRNYTKKTFDNFSNLNIIIGKNGIGKTSIIESIYLGSLAKSFKTNNELSIIKEGKDFFRIKVYYFDYGPKKNLEIFLDKSGKKTKINSQPQRKLSNFISQYRIIMLSPDELKLIKSSPNTRRNYLNIQLSQLHKEYMHYLNNYTNLIKNKNDYLKKIPLTAQLIAKYKMDDQLDQLLVTREIQDEIKPKIQDKIDELSKNLFNTINQTIKDNFDDIFRQQSENMSNYYEFVD